MANWEEPGSALAWLRQWEQLIRARDFEAAEAMFRADAFGFGTVTDTTRSRAELVERQWRVVWPRTRDFSFVWEDVHVQVSREGSMAMIFAPWRSVGAPVLRERRGRCTIGLVRDDPRARWLCIHTHFSMWPQSADAPLLAGPDI